MNASPWLESFICLQCLLHLVTNRIRDVGVAMRIIEKSLSFGAAIAVTALFLIGCDRPATEPEAVPDVAITTQASTIKLPAFVGVTITNNSTLELRLGLCADRMEMKSKAGWIPVVHGFACDAMLAILRPGSSITGYFEVPDVPPGTYRFRYAIRDANGNLLPEPSLVSNLFTVE